MGHLSDATEPIESALRSPPLFMAGDAPFSVALPKGFEMAAQVSAVTQTKLLMLWQLRYFGDSLDLLCFNRCFAAVPGRQCGCMLQLNRYRALVEEHREAGAVHIKVHGWPPRNTLINTKPTSSAGDESNISAELNQRANDVRGRYAQQENTVSRCCELCKGNFGALWLHRGVCYACEMQLREMVCA